MVRLRDCLGLDVAKTIEQPQALPRTKSQQTFALRMDVSQLGRKLFKHRDCGRLVVDKYPALTAGGNLTAKNQLFIGVVNAVFFEDPGNCATFYIKDGGNNGLPCAVADHAVGDRPATHTSSLITPTQFPPPRFPPPTS